MRDRTKPCIVLVIGQDGSMNASSSRGSGGSEGGRDIVVDVHIVIGVCPDDGVIYRRIRRWDMTKDEVRMAMEKCCL